MRNIPLLKRQNGFSMENSYPGTNNTYINNTYINNTYINNMSINENNRNEDYNTLEEVDIESVQYRCLDIDKNKDN